MAGMGLLIRRFWVRVPGGTHEGPGQNADQGLPGPPARCKESNPALHLPLHLAYTSTRGGRALSESLRNRFEAKVDRSGEHHAWTGSRTRDGAGKLKVDGKTVSARRVTWEFARGALALSVSSSRPARTTKRACGSSTSPCVASHGGQAAASSTGLGIEDGDPRGRVEAHGHVRSLHRRAGAPVASHRAGQTPKPRRRGSLRP
jgi:hypothetical protein